MITHLFQETSADDATQPFGWRRLAHLTRDEALARDAHRMAILRHLVAHPGESRQALTDALALPRSTAATLVSHLLAEGWLQEREAAAIGRGGRLAAPLHVQPHRLLLLGAEMNAGSVRVVATTLTGELIGSEQTHHDAGQDAHAALAVLVRLLLRMQARVYSPDRRVLGVGLGTSGGMGVDVLRLLGERLRGTPLQRTPVHLQEDALVAALGELMFGADADRTPMLYLNIAPSASASVMVQDAPSNGVWRLAREVGHLRRPGGLARCPCGQPGCADALRDSLQPFPLHAGGDIGALLGGLSLAYRPARIVLGGAARTLGAAFLKQALQTLTQRLAASGTPAPAVSLARFGSDAVAMGAAALALHRLVRPLSEPSVQGA